MYQWAKEAFGGFWGFLIAWNLWVYAVVVLGSILFVVPTDLAYSIGPRAAGSQPATWPPFVDRYRPHLIACVAVRGLSLGKWLHKGGFAVLLAYTLLMALPFWSLLRGKAVTYTPIPFAWPGASWLSLVLFGQMTVGALSGLNLSRSWLAKPATQRET